MLNYQRVYSWVLRHALHLHRLLSPQPSVTCRTLSLASLWTRTQACPKPHLFMALGIPCYTLVYTHTYYLGWCLSWTLLWLMGWFCIGFTTISTPQISKNRRCRVSRPLGFPDFTGVWCQPRIKKTGWFGGHTPRSDVIFHQSLPLLNISRKPWCGSEFKHL